MLTTEQLQAIMPQLPAAKRAALFPFLSAAATEFAIDSPARTAAFLAQLAHESAQFRFMEEIWGPTPAQRRYEPQSTLATTLGNTDTGDGFRFKGRGPIQITGRANYRRFGDLLGLDLVANPSSAARSDVAFRVAALFWSKKGLNELADQVTPAAFKEITRRINGGFNGLEERERFYETAKAVLGVTPPPVTRGGPPAEADTEDPVFDRGFEAIRADVPEKVARKSGARKKKPAAKKRSVKQTAARRVAKKATKKAAKTARPARTAKTRGKAKSPARKKAAATRTAKKPVAKAKSRKAARKRR
jgi:predicted chitinase